MNESYWYFIIYPQCLWLLFTKLYHNELLQVIKMVKDNENTLQNNFKQKSDMTQDLLTQELLTDVNCNDSNYSSNLSGQMVQQVTRLFSIN